MASQKLDESAFRHLMRVRIERDGPKGRLLRCPRRDGTGHYWRIKLDGAGGWAWPDHRMILDGPGDRVGRCSECGLPFMSDQRSPLCPNCEPQAFGEPSEIRRHRAYLYGTPTPVKPPADLTPEQRAEAAALRRRDEEDSPF